MPWVKIDDKFPEHPKLAEVGPVGMAMQVAALCYCNRNLTDGFIPFSVVDKLLPFAFVTAEGKRYHTSLSVQTELFGRGFEVTGSFIANLLVDSEIWDEVVGGYQIHDYLEYQPSKEDVLKEREAAAERMRTLRGKR